MRAYDAAVGNVNALLDLVGSQEAGPWNGCVAVPQGTNVARNPCFAAMLTIVSRVNTTASASLRAAENLYYFVLPRNCLGAVHQKLDFTSSEGIDDLSHQNLLELHRMLTKERHLRPVLDRMGRFEENKFCLESHEKLHAQCVAKLLRYP